MAEPRFDKRYYDRFYRNPKTRAVTPAAARRQAQFVAAYLKHLDVPVKSILDIGCGTGTVLRALSRTFPRARAQGVEYSEYLCRRYGWTPGSVVDWSARAPFDLVVCHDVLAYLDTADCERALDNLATLTGTALCLGVLTREDLEVCDRSRTDLNQTARPAAWYRARLARHFTAVGGGMFLRNPVEVTLWSLDRAAT
jgi:trans-aconitate methyltransferase